MVTKDHTQLNKPAPKSIHFQNGKERGADNFTFGMIHLVYSHFRKTNISYPWYAHVGTKDVRNVSSPENFAKVLNEWLLFSPFQPTITCSKLTIETLEQRCEIFSKLTIKTPKRHQWRRFGVFIVIFEHISHLCSNVSIVNFEQVNANWVEERFIILIVYKIYHCDT